MTAAIELEGVCKSYPHFRLRNIDLRLPTGSIMGFIGFVRSLYPAWDEPMCQASVAPG